MGSRKQAAGAALPDAWRKGKPADIKRTRPATSVLSVRVPRDLLKELANRARREGKAPSILARELLERGLSPDSPTTPAELARAFSRWVEESLRPAR
ncbi:MAG: hypothetical protein WDA71_04060 [Actinomycetota bacterium]